MEPFATNTFAAERPPGTWSPSTSAPSGRFTRIVDLKTFAGLVNRLTSLIADEPVTDAWLTGDEYGTETAPEEQEREDAEEAFFEAVVDFASKIVREVMVPRTDMICLEDAASVPEAVRVTRGQAQLRQHAAADHGGNVGAEGHLHARRP